MKKLLSLVLCPLFLCAFATTNAFAENFSSSKMDSYIEARYSDFSMTFATLHQGSNGFYEISGGAGTFSSQKWVEVTVTLEACGSDGNYRPVDGYQWISAGYGAALASGTRDLPGGAYRTHTLAKCYLNGTLLETVNTYSNIVNVPYV